MTSSKTQRVPFGKYLLLDRINVGGMAEVWRGKTHGQSGSEELVAIKRILPSISEDKEFVSMFIDEAKITVQLTHPNIGQVFELGQINGSYFIAMEYISSKDLRSIFDHCRRLGEPAPIGLTCYVVSLMCDALDHAHRKRDNQGRPMNIIHRDVSPQNILITYDGDVKIIDFGIAKAVGRASRTQAGILKGKFAYMSPEQVCQSSMDHRSDIFSIGTCFHEVLTGQRLFAGDTDFAILEKVRKADVAPPSKINPRVPIEVEKIALKALAREASERYQYASEMADDLKRYLSSLESPFTHADMGKYMSSTFAEELETERGRLREYAQIKLDARVPERNSNSFAIRRAGRPSMGPPTANQAEPLSSGQRETFDVETLRDDGRLRDAFRVEDMQSALLEPLTDPGAPPNSIPPSTIRRAKAPTNPTVKPLGGTPLSKSETHPARRPSSRDVPKVSRWTWLLSPNYSALNTFFAFVAGSAAALAISAWPLHHPKGFLLIDVTEEARSNAKILVNGENWGTPAIWPVLRPQPVGPAVITITAEGFEPFTAATRIQEGDSVARVDAHLRPIARRGHLVIVTDPEASEIRINGEIVRREGDSSSEYTGEFPMGHEYEIEVRHSGYRSFESKASIANIAEPVRVIARLEQQQ